MGAPEEPGSVLLRSWLLRSRVGDSQERPSPTYPPWPLLQLLAHYHHIPTAHATPEQHLWLHTHFERASAEDTATVAWGPSAAAEWRFHRGLQ